MTEPISVIYATFENLDEARRVGEDLVARRAAACVNIIPRMISIYRWRDSFHNSEEVILLAKTKKNLAKNTIDEIKRLHSADTPAIFELTVGQVERNFAEFVGRL